MSVPTLRIPARFNGPPESANGGITAGELAELLPAGATVQVTLRMPPPLDTDLAVRLAHDGAALRAFDGEVLIAEAAVVEESIEPVPAVEFEVAARAAQRFEGLHDHPFPTCFVCGVRRPDGNGIAAHAGPVDPSVPTLVATPFVPGDDLHTATVMWAALDCPGGWAIGLAGRRAVLGRMTALVARVAEVGERCVVVGQGDGWDGRKAFSRSSVYGEDGGLLAVARATWIELR